MSPDIFFAALCSLIAILPPVHLSVLTPEHGERPPGGDGHGVARAHAPQLHNVRRGGGGPGGPSLSGLVEILLIVYCIMGWMMVLVLAQTTHAHKM